MPVYLCRPGNRKGQVLEKPWRHHLQVYAAPFEMDAGTANNNNSDTNTTAATVGDEGSSHVDVSSTMAVAGSVAATNSSSNDNNIISGGGSNIVSGNSSVDHPSAATVISSPLESFGGGGTPVRKIRYGEIVLVDDVCVAYGRYWLRLRWPGRRHGGFAGYVALGEVVVDNDGHPKQLALEETGSTSSAVAVSGSLPGMLSYVGCELWWGRRFSCCA